MKSRRVYRVLAVFAVLHGLALFGFATVALRSEWGTRLWIAFTTFWFFWPIVLALHPGQIVWKVVSLTTIVLLTLPLFRLYDLIASSAFGWPEGFSLTPWRAVSWTNAYRSGRAEAINDIKHGRLVIEECGFGAGMGHRVQILRDRYGIELKPTAQCIVNSQIQIAKTPLGWTSARKTWQEQFRVFRPAEKSHSNLSSSMTIRAQSR